MDFIAPAPVTSDLSSLTPDDLLGGADVPIVWDVGSGSVSIFVTAVENFDPFASQSRFMTCTSDDSGSFVLPSEALLAVSDFGSEPTGWTAIIMRQLVTKQREDEDNEVRVYCTPTMSSETILNM